MIGRGCRRLETKPDFLIIDVVDVAKKNVVVLRAKECVCHASRPSSSRSGKGASARMLPPASAKFPFERLACEELAGIGIARNVEFRLRFVLAPEPIFFATRSKDRR